MPKADFLAEGKLAKLCSDLLQAFQTEVLTALIPRRGNQNFCVCTVFTTGQGREKTRKKKH